MKNSRVSDVRIVKCPKCTKLLPEPADVPFYICGGCNTTLQAKYYKKADERRNTVSGGSGPIKINEDDSSLEPGHLKVEKPSKSLINTGEVPGDHGTVGKHEDGKASSSNEPKEQVSQDEIVVEEELLSANYSSEDASPETNTTNHEEKALSNQEAGELNQNDDVSSCRLEQDEVASSSREVLLSMECSRRKTTVPVQTAELEPKLGVSNSRSEPTRPDEPRVGVKKLTSQLGSPDGEVTAQNIPANHSKEQPGFGVKYESEASSRDEHVFIDGSSSQFLRSNREGEGANGVDCNGEPFGGVSSKIATSSNESVLIQDREPPHLTTEDNKILDGLPSEINSSFRISSEKNESALLIPEAVQRSGSDLSYKVEVSPPSGQGGKRESEQSFEADKFGSKPYSKVTETAAVNANLQARSSHGDLPKSPTRNSFASDGSVSSSETVAEDKRRQHPSKTNKTCRASTLHRQTDDLQTVSGSDSFHSAAQSIPTTLDEIGIGFRHGSHRRTRTRPRTETSYESSTRASLVHEEMSDHRIHYQPYTSRDTDSTLTKRHPRRSDVNGRIFPNPTWTKEELPICPYHESNERHQICCQGARRAAYRPLTRSMAQIPYSGETVRSAYQVNDPHYRPRPAFESWSSHLPYHHRSRYIPREAFDSYAESDYYSISEDQRQRDEDMSRLRSRRKSQALQHFQPIGGAAPFITCYKCSELLQLPSDFLLFKGVRIHRVKCSACSTVLKYSLEKGSHLVPYSSKSTVGNDVDEEMELSSAFRRCASTSTYAADSEKTSLDKGKSVMAETPDGPRVTRKQPSRSSPPLHQLMGYSTLSAALDGRVPNDDQETN